MLRVLFEGLLLNDLRHIVVLKKRASPSTVLFRPAGDRATRIGFK